MERHLDLVFSVCRREIRDPELAEDVTQAVFLILAEKAASIKSGTLLVGWLFKTARFVSRNALRKESRRKAGEQEVIEAMAHSARTDNTWHQIEPLLHSGMDHLAPRERDALLLRYFQGKSFAEIGNLTGITEDAARKRTARAVEQLKLYLKKHGVAVPVAMLAAVMAEKVVLAAPASCAPVVMSQIGVSSSMAGAKATVLSKEVLKAMVLRNLVICVVAIGIATAGIGTGLVAQSQQQSRSEQQKPDAQPGRPRVAGGQAPPNHPSRPAVTNPGKPLSEPPAEDDKQRDAAKAQQETLKAQRNARLVKAEGLREKWRPWALKHRAILRSLLHAREDDQATLMYTWNALPPKAAADTTGFTQEYLSSPVSATWQPGIKVSSSSKDPKDIKTLEDARQRVMRMVQADFIEMRDIRLSRISGVGTAADTDFWASGRITERELGSRKLPKKILGFEHGGMPYQEIFPPYDFLK